MESTLLQTKCSGCGEVENETKFKACPTCIELKMLPSVYCCEECFRVDWKSHKKKHDAFANLKARVSESEIYKEIVEIRASKLYRGKIKRKSKEGNLLYSQMVALIKCAKAVMDHDRAETLCRKAISRFPSYPYPYHVMADILISQGNFRGTLRFLELSMEKACRLFLTADKKTNDPVELFLTHSMQCIHFLEQMNWIFSHLKENVDTFDTCKSSVFIADWMLNEKKFLSLWSYYFEILKDSNSFDWYHLHWKVEHLHPESIISLLQARRTQTHQEVDHNSSSSPYFDGEWVIAHGLTSSVGKTLNHRVAMVKGEDLNEEGRVAVVFKEGGLIKFLKVENLKHARTVNAKAALLMFLDEPEQWKFMLNDFLSV